MIDGAIRHGQATEDFARLHRVFVQQFGIAVGLAWAASAIAATQAPWLRNIRGLIDPFGPAESTASYLFGLPILMALGWVSAAFGADLMRRATVLRNQAIEFAVAGLVIVAVLSLAVHRAVTAFTLAS